MLLTSKTAKLSRRRKLVYFIAPTILVAGLGVAVTAPAAHASTCVNHSGKTSTERETDAGPMVSGGTVWTEPAGCTTLEVVSVGATDSYEGWLFSTVTENWVACTDEGFKKITAGGSGSSTNTVLCTGVKATTQMAVITLSGKQRSLTING